MPELPEVQTIVSTLRPRVLGRVIRGVTLSRRDIVTPVDLDLVSQLTGRTIREVGRRGEGVGFSLARGNRFCGHLRTKGPLVPSPPPGQTGRPPRRGRAGGA